MYRKLLLSIAIMAVILIVSCKLFEKEEPKTIEVYGCMDSLATNYDPEATIDDGSCDYCKEGSSFILISMDSGNTWDIRCLKDKIGMITDVSMVDSNNIWVCTYPNIFARNAQILQSSNGGRTWKQQLYFDSHPHAKQITFEYIEMFDLNNGIALANNTTDNIPMFLKTVDGGKNWVQTTTEAIGVSGDMWRRVDFVDINTGYFYASIVSPQKLYKTTNSGITWSETNYDGGVMVLKFYDEDIGIAVPGYGRIYRTLDGGDTWEEIETAHTSWGMDIEFDPNDPSKVWLLTLDDVYFSSDTGSTWVDFTGAEKIMGQALCVTESNIWIKNGTLYSINKNGTDITNIQLPESPYGNLALLFDFDVVGDVIVIPGRLSK